MRRVNKGRNGGKTKAWRRAEHQREVCLPVLRLNLQLTQGKFEAPARWGRWCKLLDSFGRAA